MTEEIGSTEVNQPRYFEPSDVWDVMSRKRMKSEMPRLRFLFLGVVVGSCLLAAIIAFKAVVPTQGGFRNSYGSFVGGDFLVFFAAGYTVVSGHLDRVYDPAYLYALQDQLAGEPTPNMPFVYPPVALFLYLPFAVFPYLPAFYLWLTTTLGTLAIVLRRITESWLLPALIIFSPLVLKAAVTGQSGNVNAVLIGAGMLLLWRHPILAGMFLGCMVFKPHLALMLPVCLASGRHWRAFVSTGGTAALLMLLSVVVFGPECWSGFLHNAGDHGEYFFTDVGYYWYRVPTVFVSVQHLTGDDVLAWTMQAIIGVVALTVTAITWWRSTDPFARSMSLVAATFLMTPKALYYDLAMAAVPLAFLAAETLRGRIRLGAIFFGSVLWASPSVGEVARNIGWQPGPLVLLGALAFAFKQSRQSCNTPVEQSKDTVNQSPRTSSGPKLL